MAILYYGSGSCTIEGSDIRGVHITYRGVVKIKKTCGDNFAITANNNNIIIFPISKGFLTDLFSYVGEINIASVTVSDNNGEEVATTVKRVMDYPELMNTKAEDLTVKSESLNAGYRYRNRTKKTTVNQKTIDNLNTSDGEYYKKDGIKYDGEYHIHISSGKAMTGAKHTDKSEDLYIKQKRDGKLVRTEKITKTKTTPRTITRTLPRITSRGTSGGSGGGGY
tara:strand:- start:243 stop:911 length:669 start_codon:yes stop_codon:yes gene_type:complete